MGRVRTALQFERPQPLLAWVGQARMICRERGINTLSHYLLIASLT